MTKIITILTSHRSQALDITGPAAVFSSANDLMPNNKPYKLEIVSPEGGAVETVSGVSLNTKPIASVRTNEIDTFLIAGHDETGTLALINNHKARDWTIAVAKSARRWGSVCSGSFALAAWGLLDGRRAATHWSGADILASSYPNVDVDAEAIYVTDEKVWTSAGVTAGIDMSLAMVEADLGQEVAVQIARRLVVYMRRPGSQSQFSGPLQYQHEAASAYGDLIDWAKGQLNQDLTVRALAERAGQSLRTFQRRFRQQTGQSPAACIEALRLERAKALIGADVPLKMVAHEIGYPSASQLTSVFRRRFGLSPSVWKTMHTQAL